MAAKTKGRSRNASTAAKARVRPPPMKGDALVQRAQQAKELVANNPEVKPRLEAGVLENLDADVATYEGKRIESKTVGSEVRAASSKEDESARLLAMKTSAIRNAIIKSTSKASVRKGYGIDKPVRYDVTTSVVAAAEVIVNRATNEKTRAEAMALGIIDSDIEMLKKGIAALKTADSTQKSLKAAKPLTTRERNEAGQRVWNALKLISAKGILAYSLDEQRRAQFDALDDLPRKRATGG